ncbi:Bug family tripartite tricarboxylate transporter substrate binding protein [Massilia sp. Mn16-1_5]|uniref:Bug family tripartite tricarboxylate transporter substrate binding protein n=1 Tax=Massilia sp. Mn16-1_5 TaxID=2079199 RepID=UPI002684A8BE
MNAKKLLLGVLSSMVLLTGAQAAYPEKPITAVVPFPPGGSTDAIARAVGQKVSTRFGQPWVVDNRPGATGAIGAGLVKRAPADGYTVMVASIGVYAVNQFLQKGLAYNPQRDFDLLTVAVRAPNVLVARPDLPASTIQDFIAYLKKNPGKVNFASSGNGSSDHLTAELFWQKSGTSGLHVPYKGGAPAITDLLGGQTDVSFVNINAALPYIKSGKLKALAVTGEQRAAVLPKLPTLAESGVPGVEIYSWQAIAAPKGLPKDVKAKLHGAIVAALNEPDLKSKLVEQGFEVVGNTPEQFDQFLAAEQARWKNVIEVGKITLD